MAAKGRQEKQSKQTNYF